VSGRAPLTILHVKFNDNGAMAYEAIELAVQSALELDDVLQVHWLEHLLIVTGERDDIQCDTQVLTKIKEKFTIRQIKFMPGERA
jgi:hypothetical protein